MIGDFACRLLLHTFGYLWPAYCSYKALETKQTAAVENWCRYWLVLALFATAERMVTDWTLFWVPLYYEGKLLFVLWLWHSSTRGAQYLYSRLLTPAVRPNEAAIDQFAAESQAILLDYVSNGARWLVQWLQQNAYLLKDFLGMLKSGRDNEEDVRPAVRRRPAVDEPQPPLKKRPGPQTGVHSRDASGPDELRPEDVPSWMGGTRDASRAGSMDEVDDWPVPPGQQSPPRHQTNRSISPGGGDRKWR